MKRALAALALESLRGRIVPARFHMHRRQAPVRMKRLRDVAGLDFSAAIVASDRAPGAISLAER